MDFLRIILDGYFDKNNREHLSKYFYRQFKKAEKDEFFEATEFFDGCDNILDVWEKDLTNRMHRRKEELYQLINIAQGDNCLSEEERSIKIKSFKKELENERPDGIGNSTYSIFLPNVTNNKVYGNLPYSEFEYIKASLLKAHIKSFKEELHQQAEIIIDTPEEEKQEEKLNSIHPEYNPNLWNKEAYELFKYLYDNYYTEGRQTKVKLTNIWFYIREDDPSKYSLFATKDEYKDFIKKNYNGIELKSFDKSEYKYNETDYPTMNDHRQNYEKALSKL